MLGKTQPFNFMDLNIFIHRPFKKYKIKISPFLNVEQDPTFQYHGFK
jgi:hypothetical protein